MKKTLLFFAIMTITFTQAQVSLVKDGNPGSGDGIGNELIVIPNTNKIAYSGTENGNLYYLWESEGLPSNTMKHFNSNTYEFPDPTLFYKWEQLDKIIFFFRNNSY